MEFLEMQPGAVALVLAETILRKARAKFTHQTVAGHLRNHACGRDAQAEAIAVDDRRLREREGENRQAINQDMIGRYREAGDRDPHRLVRCAQDVNSVDLQVIDSADCPDDLGMRGEVMVNLSAQVGGKLLRILQPAMPETLRQDRGGRHDRAGESATAGFIDARDPDNA